MYKETFQLAESKGYKAILCCLAKYGGEAALPHSVIDDARELCELSLIRDWLNDTHKLFVEVVLMAPSQFAFTVYDVDSTLTKAGYKDYSYKYKSALLQGINAALQLI